MNNLGYRHSMKMAVLDKFKGNKTLVSKYRPLYPYAVEREYVRIALQYVELLKKLLIKRLKDIDKAIKGETFRIDADDPEPNRYLTGSSIRRIFAALQREIDDVAYGFGLRDRLNIISGRIRKLSVQEWKRSIGKTLGVNIFEDYYMGEQFGQMVPQWIEENVNRIVRIPKETLDDMQTIVMNDVREGKSIRDITHDIQKRYEVSRNHAKLIARDQTGKLYGQLAKEQQTTSGITDYIWSGVMDNRERPDHVDREGKRFSWDNPPEDGHPGEPIQCRCVALPIFDWENLDIVGDVEDGEEETDW